MNIWSTISQRAIDTPQQVAIRHENRSITYIDLVGEISDRAKFYASLEGDRIALIAPNSIEWVVDDLAILKAKKCCIPIPLFFTKQQVIQALEAAAVSHVIALKGYTDQLAEIPEFRSIGNSDQRVILENAHKSEQASPNIPDNVRKITFTSGTTGNPKGVMLTESHLNAVLGAVTSRAEICAKDRHLVLSPFSILLENLMGAWAMLMNGGQLVIPHNKSTETSSSPSASASQILNSVREYGITTLILTPLTLQNFLDVIKDERAPVTLRFCALGGGKTPMSLIRRALHVGLPVYEGYGLSECGSVVALNSTKSNRPGSVGKVLEHTSVVIAEDNEIVIVDTEIAKYLGDSTRESTTTFHTGDLGALDSDGYLFVHGRKRNVFITSNGRNVSPEWIEQEYLNKRHISQLIVFGEGKAENTAVIFSVANDGDIEATIRSTNQLFPDYAQIHRWIRAECPFSVLNGQMTATGRYRRNEIFQNYKHLLS